jgi:hypothetical protein
LEVIEGERKEIGANESSGWTREALETDSFPFASKSRRAFELVEDERFTSNPRLYLSRVTLFALTCPEKTRPLTEFLFPKLLSGPPARRRLVHLAIRIFGKPREILEVACEQFRIHGYEGRLIAAASLLGEFGTESWAVLREFASSGAPESEAFVELVASLEGVPTKERIDALADLARSADQGTRQRAFEVLGEFGFSDKGTQLMQSHSKRDG